MIFYDVLIYLLTCFHTCTYLLSVELSINCNMLFFHFSETLYRQIWDECGKKLCSKLQEAYETLHVMNKNKLLVMEAAKRKTIRPKTKPAKNVGKRSFAEAISEGDPRPKKTVRKNVTTISVTAAKRHNDPRKKNEVLRRHKKTDGHTSPYLKKNGKQVMLKKKQISDLISKRNKKALHRRRILQSSDEEDDELIDGKTKPSEKGKQSPKTKVSSEPDVNKEIRNTTELVLDPKPTTSKEASQHSDPKPSTSKEASKQSQPKPSTSKQASKHSEPKPSTSKHKETDDDNSKKRKGKFINKTICFHG